MRQIPIDSYGRVYRNRKLAEDDGRQSKLNAIARYRFCLSLENSLAPNYVTEKLFDPLMVGTLPVYRGAPDAAQGVLRGRADRRHPSGQGVLEGHPAADPPGADGRGDLPAKPLQREHHEDAGAGKRALHAQRVGQRLGDGHAAVGHHVR